MPAGEGARAYLAGQPISVTFTNGPGNAKDWVGIYKEGQTPGGPSSTLWAYVDGTQSGNAAKTDGVLSFPTGLTEPGLYVAHFLVNDTYDILASETCALDIIGAKFVRDVENGEGEMPYPPDYPKMPGEPRRVQPSRKQAD